MHRMSEPQMVEALTSSKTCPLPGAGIGTSLSSTVLFPGKYAALIISLILPPPVRLILYIRSLERFHNSAALANSVQGGFFLRKTPRGGWGFGVRQSWN